MTLSEVAQAVRRGSLDLSAGAIRSEAGDILVRTKEDAEKVEAELATGRDFVEVAKEMAIGPSRPTGGDLGTGLRPFGFVAAICEQAGGL